MPRQLVLCNCMGSQRIDADGLSVATGLACSRVHSELCISEAAAAEAAIRDGDAVIACAQERARFEELAGAMGADPPRLVDIRDRAGWTEDGNATPKMAALIAEALLPEPSVKTLDITSAGACLIIGPGEVAFAAAERLSGQLAVTVMVTDTADLPPTRRFEVVQGRLTSATGTLGAFELRFDALRTVQPGGRGELALTGPRDGARTICDIIVDLSGGAPLFPAPHKRDGYLRADPGSAAAVAAAVFEAAQLVGTFEKPLYVTLTEHLCAHSRAGQIGCSRCLDACPTGAIVPDGENVKIDPLVCAGCGACAALCPSGAIAYDAPPAATLLRRVGTLAEAFRKAGGGAPRLLVHDAHGAEVIRLAARFGRGLPADVIPLEVMELATAGHAEMLAALAMGFAAVDLLLSPGSDREVLGFEHALAAAMGGEGRLRLLDIDDPDALPEALYGTAPEAHRARPILPMGNRQQVARLAARALVPGSGSPLPLPDGAPYGAVLVNTEACTLCLSCVSLCPSGALIDNPDKPQLRFQEDACLQCGICRTVCPEDAIALRPQMDLSDAALGQRVLKEEEPFHCIDCGRPFGVRSTVERILEKLAGKHPMFPDTAAGRTIQMCDDCRIKAQFAAGDNPMSLGERPRPRTTGDYLSRRRDH